MEVHEGLLTLTLNREKIYSFMMYSSTSAYIPSFKRRCPFSLIVDGRCRTDRHRNRFYKVISAEMISA